MPVIEIKTHILIDLKSVKHYVLDHHEYLEKVKDAKNGKHDAEFCLLCLDHLFNDMQEGECVGCSECNHWYCELCAKKINIYSETGQIDKCPYCE